MPIGLEWSTKIFEKKKKDYSEMDIHEVLHCDTKFKKKLW